MAEVCLDPAGGAVVPLGWVKHYLKVDHDTDDEIISRHIISAQTMIENYARIAFSPKRWRRTTSMLQSTAFHSSELRSGHYWGPIRLSAHPFIEVIEVLHRDFTGTRTIADYQIKDCGSVTELYVPRSQLHKGSYLSIVYRAGYEDIGDVPDLYKDAICLAVKHLYRRRDDLDPGLGAYRGLPEDVCALLLGEQPVGWLS